MKRLLLQFVGLFLVSIGALAYGINDYVYTPTAKYKVTGDNLITNGSFTAVDFSSNSFGWKDAGGLALGADNWSIETGAGPAGENVIQSQSNLDGVSMCQAVPFSAGQSLIVTLKIKGTEAATSSITENSANYIDVYANIDGSVSKTADRFQQVAEVSPITAEWSEISFAFTDTVSGGSTGYLVINFGRLTANTQITDVEVHEVSQVYDTRVAQRALDYNKYLWNLDIFTNKVSELGDAVSYLENALVSDEDEYVSMRDDISQMETFLSDMQRMQTEYLNANSADVSGALSSFDISGWPKFNNGDGVTGQGDWKLYGPTMRWGHANGATFSNLTFPSNYDMLGGTAAIEKVGMMPGKYFFSLEASGLKYTKVGSDYYAPNYSFPVEGTKMFVGNKNNTTSLECGTLDPRVFNRYSVIADIAEGDTLQAGITFAGFGEGNGGGTYRFQGAVLRLVGVSQDAFDRSVYVNNIHVQQNALKERLQLAAADAVNGNPWGAQDVLDSIAKYQELYDASLAYVDVNGVDMGVEIPNDGDYHNTILAWVRAMNTTRNNYSNLNKPYNSLKSYITEATAVLNNDENATASASARTALESGIATSQALVNNVRTVASGDDGQGESFTTSQTTLTDLVVKFTNSAASFANPSPIAIVNPSFKTNGGQKSRKADGWTLTGQTDSGTWQFGADESFDDGYVIYVSRGYSAYSKNKVIQTITISNPGMYEFKCQAYAVNTHSKEYNGMWNGISGADSVRVSGIGIFFGPENAPDSIQNVCTKQTVFGTSVWSHDEVRWYSIKYDKKTDGDEVVEFGMDANENGVAMGFGCNLYAFGSCRLFYYGATDAYLTGIENVDNNDAAKNATIYTISGVNVGNNAANLPKGIYIKGGKKFVVK